MPFHMDDAAVLSTLSMFLYGLQIYFKLFDSKYVVALISLHSYVACDYRYVAHNCMHSYKLRLILYVV